MADDSPFPEIPVELRPLFLRLINAYAETMDRSVDGAGYGPQARFSRRFADADGYVNGITQIVNTVTGETVTLPEPIRVHLRDIDRVIDEYQAQFLAEWEAQHA